MPHHFYLSFLLPLLLLPSANSVYFQISQFNDTNMYYQGDAVPFGGHIEFNLVDYINRVGWATYPERVRLWDSRSGQLSDFTSHFSFTINTQGATNYGHGIAFFLAPVGFQIPPNSAGGFLGLFNTTTMQSPQSQIVSVEFDSFPNYGWDPKVGHVGINNNSISSALYTPWNASFHSGDTAEAWITYNSTDRNLSVFWEYQTTSDPRENSSLFYIIDLSKFLPEWVTVGFSAATGSNVEQQRLLSWEFNSSLNVKEMKGNKNSKKSKIKIDVIVSVLVLIAGATTAFVILWRRKQMMTRKRAAETMNVTSINEALERGAGPRRFSYDDLVSATNNFSDQRKLGEGGFGAVYRGYLNDMDMEIAVKKISRSSRQGKKEYITEVKTISQLRHRNLVQLIGWCHDKDEFMVVYEFMSNGSLDSHLFGKRKMNPLSWVVRYKISLGLASALLYLHEEWERCVVHRDVKSSNIMLDSSFNVKLGDFGLARLMDHDEPGPTTTGLAGTFGYMAPEYISTRRAGKESDVYSFGVVALEIASGRKANDPVDQNPEMSLVEWIWDLYGCGHLSLAVDKRLDITDFDDEKQAERLMIVGLWCAHPDRNLRPSIGQAIHVLNLEAAIPDLPPKMPVPVFHVPLPLITSSQPCSITNTSLEAGGR
uniref:non-specific serine/threonine protein kinase n=1 Tax=Populus trichocarpa TaxID=3694 RepID=A0A2K1ZLW6_POPTR|eukprot:XP_002310340.3 L-type lectin-domain containing receptor kinase IX.1 [Populus trichocarpa]